MLQTTFMDCLAGRKTAGRITGDVRVNGHPQVHSTFARISGYCEQVADFLPLPHISPPTPPRTAPHRPASLALPSKPCGGNHVQACTPMCMHAHKLARSRQSSTRRSNVYQGMK